jgi:hypothetical protein
LPGASGELAGWMAEPPCFRDTGADVVLSTDPALADDSDAARIFVTYGKLAESVGVGSKVLLDDGAIILEVKAISGGEVCRSASTRSPAPSRSPLPRALHPHAAPHRCAGRSSRRCTASPRTRASSVRARASTCRGAWSTCRPWRPR